MKDEYLIGCLIRSKNVLVIHSGIPQYNSLPEKGSEIMLLNQILYIFHP